MFGERRIRINFFRKVLMPCAKHRIIFKTDFAYGPGIFPGFHFTAGFERGVFEQPATGEFVSKTLQATKLLQSP